MNNFNIWNGLFGHALNYMLAHQMHFFPAVAFCDDCLHFIAAFFISHVSCVCLTRYQIGFAYIFNLYVECDIKGLPWLPL